MAAIFSPFLQVLESLHGFTGKSLALLLDAALKGTSLLMLCGVLVLALRRASAAARHLVWSLGLGAMLALPFLSLMLPAWNVPVSSRLAFGSVSEKTVTTEGSPVAKASSQIEAGRTARVPAVAVGTEEGPLRIGWILCL